MKSITFRPLRRIKKTGKITVASYLGWRKVKTADYNKFILVINDEYKTFSKDELVYDHNGENLFWRHYNPEEIPLLTGYELNDGERPPYPPMWKTDYMYCAKGLDSDGVPTFSHQKNSGNDFEPLTVEIVSWWFGWFLYQLENSYLQITSKNSIQQAHDKAQSNVSLPL